MHPFRATLAKLPKLLGPPSQSEPERRLKITNQTRGTEMASSVEVADTAPRRSKGLLGRKGLQPGTALWIVPCESVHTFGMQFALDLVYLDKQNRIVKIRRNVPPWRMSLCLRAHSVLEFPAGALLDGHDSPGDQLFFSSFSPIICQGTKFDIGCSPSDMRRND